MLSMIYSSGHDPQMASKSVQKGSWKAEKKTILNANNRTTLMEK